MHFLNNQHVIADVLHEGNGYTAETYTTVQGVVTEDINNKKIVVTSDRQVYSLSELYNVKPTGKNLYEAEEENIKQDLASYDFDKISKASNKEEVLAAMASDFADKNSSSESDNTALKTEYLTVAKALEKEKAEKDEELKQYKKDSNDKTVSESISLPSLDNVVEVNFVVTDSDSNEELSNKNFTIESICSMGSYVAQEVEQLAGYAEKGCKLYAEFFNDNDEEEFSIELETKDDVNELIDLVTQSKASTLLESEFGDEQTVLQNTKKVPFASELIDKSEGIVKLNDEDLEKQKDYPQTAFKTAPGLKEAVVKAYNEAMHSDDVYSAFTNSLIESRYVKLNCPAKSREAFADAVFDRVFE